MRSEPFGPLRDLLDEPIDEEMFDRVMDRVEARRRVVRPIRSVRLMIPVVAAAAAVVLAFLFVSFWSSEPAQDGSVEDRQGPVHLAGGSELRNLVHLSTAQSDKRIELEDGSVIEVEPGTVIRTEKNTDRHVSLRLEKGRALFDIVPNGARQWQVNAGLAVVEVLGTRFSVVLGEGEVAVSVERGVVRVVSDELASGSKILEAVDRLVIAQNTDSTSPESSEERPSTPDAVEEQPPAKVTKRVQARSQWRSLAKSGNYDEAYQQLGALGLRDETNRAASMSDLIALADVARLSGHPREAIEPLERALRNFSSDRRASVVAFTLGRIETDHLRRYPRGARAFQKCLDLGAPRALQESAFVRLAKAQARSGDYGAARRTAQEYLRRYPDGRFADELQRWIRIDPPSE